MTAPRRAAVWTIYTQDESGSRILGQLFGDDAIQIFTRARALWPRGCLGITRDRKTIPTADARRLLVSPNLRVDEYRVLSKKLFGVQLAAAREYTRRLAERTADNFGVEQGVL